MKRTVAAIGLALAWGASGALAQSYDSLEALGEALFFDTNLSVNRTMSCATCHDPDFAFTDPRATHVGRAVSLGDDGESIGDRNAPTAAYAKFSPSFYINDEGVHVGGQFHDGRAPDLEFQAGGPPLNPAEMAMPDTDAVVARLRENPAYEAGFVRLFGADVWAEPWGAYRAMSEAIAAFERTDLFSPFDSKYDRFLRGEVELTNQEELGRLLFFSEQFTNCALCHQLRTSPVAPDETFTNYQFHNIGVPTNATVRAANGIGSPDEGLNAHLDMADPAHRGKFKVPTLRNIAVTGPYMHNGVFEDLRTVILFYNKYNSRAEARQINPETGQPWGAPEVAGTLSVEELTHGPALDDKRVDALVAFLKTLTDARYEGLLEE